MNLKTQVKKMITFCGCEAVNYTKTNGLSYCNDYNNFKANGSTKGLCCICDKIIECRKSIKKDLIGPCKSTVCYKLTMMPAEHLAIALASIKGNVK